MGRFDPAARSSELCDTWWRLVHDVQQQWKTNVCFSIPTGAEPLSHEIITGPCCHANRRSGFSSARYNFQKKHKQRTNKDFSREAEGGTWTSHSAQVLEITAVKVHFRWFAVRSR